MYFSFLEKIYFKHSLKLHFVALIFFTILTLQILLNNFLVGIFGYGLTPNRFTDLWLMIKLSNCFNEIGWDIYQFRLNNECYNYYYGKPFVYVIDLLKLNYNNYQWFGWVQILALSYFLAFMYKSLIRIYSFKVVAVLILSPPIFLLASLGNSDIIVICVVFISIKILRKPNYVFFSFLLICFVTVIKLYTLPILFYYMLLIKNKVQKILSLLIFMGVIFSVANSQFTVGSSALQRLNYNSSFGISVFGSWLSAPQVKSLFHPISPISRWMIGLIVTILLVTIHYHFFHKFKYPLINNDKKHSNEFNELITVSIVCLTLYAVGTSFDYKLVWFIWLLASCSELVSDHKVSKLFLFSAIGSVWLSYSALSIIKYFDGFYVLQPLGDIFVGIQISIIVYRLYPILKIYFKQNIFNFKNNSKFNI